MHKGFGRPTVFYALIVIFAEFFAWGLLTTPTITALKKTFPGQTLMINGLIWGIKVSFQFLHVYMFNLSIFMPHVTKH